MSNINKCDIYVILWCLYRMQGILYPQGIINQIFLLIIIFVGLYNMAIYYKSSKNRNTLFDSIGVLTFVYIFYGIIYIFLGDVRFGDGTFIPRHLYLQNGLYSLVPFFALYVYAKQGKLLSTHIQWYFFVLLVVIISNFYFNYNNLLANALYGRTEFTNNVGYEFITLFPLLFLIKNNLLKIFSAGFILIFVFMGMKRGAILIGLICFGYFFFNLIKRTSGSRKFVIFVISAVTVVFAYKYLSDFISGSDYFNRRIEATLSGDSSGRDGIYANIWKGFWDKTNLFQILFGMGANGSVSLAGNYAHEDWLEILCNNGIIGVFLLLTFYYRFVDQIKRMHLISNKASYSILVMCLFIVFLKSLFSMSITSMHMALVIAIVYGITNVQSGRNETTSLY